MLNEKNKQTFIEHVLEQYPKEACGVLINDEYVKCENVSENPLHSFEIDACQLLEMKQEGTIQAILHSHPYTLGSHKHLKGFDPKWPSVKDQQSWMSDNIPWIIASTDGEGVSDLVIMDENNPAPILKRTFIWGYQDCYSLARDWYKINKGIVLKNTPREWLWWQNGENMFLDLFKDFGFRQVSSKEAQVGDLCLIYYHASVPNHIGVITGTNELTHQMFGCYSRTSPLNIWHRSIHSYLRYEQC